MTQSLSLSQQLPIYKAYGVSWVVFYSVPSRDDVSLVHSYGIGALVYVNALAATYTQLTGLGFNYATIRDWAQWGNGGSCYYIKPPNPDPAITSCPGDSNDQVRISPYSGYQGNGVQSQAYFELVLAPLVTRIVDPSQTGADGIFVDVLFLKPDADYNPHFQIKYNEVGGTFQDFRYASIHYYASRIYNLVNPFPTSPIVVINNNNLFTRSQRDSFALDISRLQDVSDVLMHEWDDLDQVDPSSPLTWVNLEINGDPNNNAGLNKVTKPLWTHYLTNQADRFRTMLNSMNSASYNFGWWAYNGYMWSNPVTQTTTVMSTSSATATSSTTSSTTAQTSSSDFYLTVTPSTLTLSTGGTTSLAVQTRSVANTTLAVAFASFGLPAGVRASFAPSVVNLPPGGSAQSTFTLSASPDSAQGIATVTVTAYSIFASHSAVIQLNLGAHYEMPAGGEQVLIVSNSETSNFSYNSSKIIQFTVAGPDGTRGFIDVTLRRQAIDGSPVLLFDGRDMTSAASLMTNSTHYRIFFQYTHSSHIINIGGSNVIAEFHSISVVVVVIAIVSLASLRRRNMNV